VAASMDVRSALRKHGICSDILRWHGIIFIIFSSRNNQLSWSDRLVPRCRDPPVLVCRADLVPVLVLPSAPATTTISATTLALADGMMTTPVFLGETATTRGLAGTTTIRSHARSAHKSP